MKTEKIIKIGTRGSKLALVQAQIVQNLLRLQGIVSETIVIKTQGDKILNKPLVDFGGKAVFVSEFEQAINDGKIDIAVHSAKDMPTFLADGLCVAACLKRENAKDVLIMPKNKEISDIKIVGTSSLRRKYQIERILSDAKCVSLRGNVPTRLEKLDNGEYDAIILAYAGIKRLGLDSDSRYIYNSFDISKFVPAAAQGIIAVEAKKNSSVCNALKSISDRNSEFCFETERYLMQRINAGCHEAVGAYSEIIGKNIRIYAMKYYNSKCNYFSGEDIIENRFKMVEAIAQKIIKSEL